MGKQATDFEKHIQHQRWYMPLQLLLPLVGLVLFTVLLWWWMVV